MHKHTDPASAAAELLKRRSIRNSLTEWARHRGFEPAPHLPPFSTRNYPLRYAGNLVSYGPTTKLPNLACSPWRGLDRLASLLNLNGRGSQVGPVCLCRRVTRRLFQSE